MTPYAFAVPLLPGKIGTWKQLLDEMRGPRLSDFQESRKRAGLQKEQVWLQSTPHGDFAVVYFETDDVGKVFERFGTSQDAFDVWFRGNVLVGCHGIDFSQGPPPLNEMVADFTA